ncbi:hypothetical protein GCM10027091_78350 [Streptomyces daliensis]
MASAEVPWPWSPVPRTAAPVFPPWNPRFSPVGPPLFPRFPRRRPPDAPVPIPSEEATAPFRRPVSAVRRGAFSLGITLPFLQVGAHPLCYSTRDLGSRT